MVPRPAVLRGRPAALLCLATIGLLVAFGVHEAGARPVESRTGDPAPPVAHDARDASAEPSAPARRVLDQGATRAAAPGYRADEGLDAAESAGREIWFNATAGNDRFHTYVFQQRLGVRLDAHRVLNTAERADRFARWGMINTPNCCTPGTLGCPARSAEETYGFDWCEGDDELLKFVGREGYRDPACDFEDAPLGAGDPHGPEDQREDPCGLKFGTSAGVFGLRKFPNPRFDEERWLDARAAFLALGDPDYDPEVDGPPSLANWDGYGTMLGGEPGDNALADGSVEPPFLIGMSCGFCHIAFDPVNPPDDPAAPDWEHVDGLIGNQYLRSGEFMASGMPTDTLEWQIFVPARPGATDTSAVPNDLVTNPGTQNAVINFLRRPTHPHEVLKWRKTDACPAEADERECWCEPGRDGKCWQRSLETESVPNILKGGEDSIGIAEAIQRVYFNIGSCSERCWVNHLMDLRQLDPAHRGYAQTPFDIGQCRRDCAEFRAIEDRLGDIAAFLLSGRPFELHEARGLEDRQALIDRLEAAEAEGGDGYGEGAVERGRGVFGETCARCHSTQEGPIESRDYYATTELADGERIRADWLGNDRPELASVIGSFPGRAMHSNHAPGHVWDEYGARSLHARAGDDSLGLPSDGGRGSYRNISLLSAWARPPFLHNNAVGPEVCGDPDDPRDFYVSPYIRVGGDGRPEPLSEEGTPECWRYDPSVDGRFDLYEASMQALLNPDERVPKLRLLDEDVVLRFGQRTDPDGDEEMDEPVLQLRIAKGIPVTLVGSVDYKRFVGDMVRARTRPDELRETLAERFGDAEAVERIERLKQILGEVVDDPTHPIEVFGEHRDFILEGYANSLPELENAGHEFGEDLSDEDKDALIAFLATL